MSRVVRDNWRRVRLGEIFDIGSSKRVMQADWRQEGVPFYRAREIVKLARDGVVDNELFISESHFEALSDRGSVPQAGDLMVSAVGTLGACYVVKGADRFYYKDASVLHFRPIASVDPEFIRYAFLSDELSAQVQAGEGATVGTFTIERARQAKILLPPLDEQKRIVAKLDQAFAALDRARDNAEANREDADKLFSAELQRQFEAAGERAELLPFDSVCEPLTPRVKLKRQDYLKEGAYPIVSQEADLISGYWNDSTALVGVEGPVVLFGDHTCCLKYVDFDFVVGADGTKILRPFTGVSAKYLYYGLRSQPIEQAGYARHFKRLRETSLPDLPMSEQKRITDHLCQLEVECGALTKEYEAKLADIAALRQSLLQAAFSGQLN